MIKKYLSLKNFKENIYLIIVLVAAFVLRFVHLGYSDFQGDEIKALYLPTQGQSFFSYILDQRKGPLQFIVTFLIKLLDRGYNNYYFDRLPFALAGFLAVFFFYKLVELHFGKRIAFFSSLFMATNGFFIAFSRLVQYQSLVILFAILSLYFLTLASIDKKFALKGVYLGLISWAFALLAHYDAIFIAPFVAYLLLVWFRQAEISKKNKVKHFVVAGIISAALLFSFYIPFAFSLSDATKDYWSSRITGDTSGKVSSSKYLFRVYQPIYSLYIYMILFTLGVIFIGLGLFSKQILKIKKLPNCLNQYFVHSTDLMKMIQKDKLKVFVLFLWIGLTCFFFEVITYIPGTHIYNYILPMFIVAAFGLVTLESLVFKVFEWNLMKIFNFIGVAVLFVFLFSQSYLVFVDNSKEYPWDQEQFLLWTLPKPSPAFHLSLFGFPYYRNWQGVRDYIRAHPETTAYTTNEKDSIARHYLGLEKKSDLAGFYIYVKNPQSFTNEILNEKANYWAQHYQPVSTFTRFGRDMIRIYIMVPGTLDEIRAKGY